MSDKTLQRKLDQLAKLADELHQEAKRRYGDGGMLFYEAEGTFHIMSGDDMSRKSGASSRQEFVEFSSSQAISMGAGAW